jgi:lipopolysaccharide transport system permease protein
MLSLRFSTRSRSDLVEINPPTSFLSGPLRIARSVRDHRPLVWSFIQRDLRLRYRNSALGYFWSLLEPLLLSAVYFLLFVIVAGSPDKAHALWIILGVITWKFFSTTLTGALSSLTKNEGMIKQVYFPRELFAVTNAGAQLIIAGLSLLVAVPFMIWLGIAPSTQLWMIPAGLALVMLFGLGVGMGLACMNVVNRDIEHFMQFVTRAGMFLSPVMWTVAQIPASKARIFDLLLLNPVVVPLTMVRNGVSGQPLGISPAQIAYSVAICLVSFLAGTMIFKRFEAVAVKKI